MATEKSPWWRKVFSKEAKSSSKSAVTETTVAQQREQPETMEQQVSPMLKELIARQEQLLREQQHLRDSGGAAVLSREMREDAEREAASLRLRAVREGEVEAARIIAQAKEKAQEVINDANRQAQEATEAEVENIIASARQKAEIIEDRARQVAQVFLLQAREDIHGFVTGEAKESYYRLLSSLQEILSTTHDLEREWKNRSVRLWEDSAFKWEEYQAALLNSVGQGRLASASGVRSSAAQDESEHASQNVSQQVETPARLVEERVATGPAAETATPPPVFDPVAALEAMGGGRKEPDQEHPVKAEDGLKTAPFVQDGSLIGDVELVLGAFTDVERLAQLYSHLQQVNGLRVLHSTGSWDKGTVIAVMLDQAMPVQTLVPDALQAQVSVDRRKAGSGEGTGMLYRVTIEFPAS